MIPAKNAVEEAGRRLKPLFNFLLCLASRARHLPLSSDSKGTLLPVPDVWETPHPPESALTDVLATFGKALALPGTARTLRSMRSTRKSSSQDKLETQKEERLGGSLPLDWSQDPTGSKTGKVVRGRTSKFPASPREACP